MLLLSRILASFFPAVEGPTAETPPYIPPTSTAPAQLLPSTTSGTSAWIGPFLLVVLVLLVILDILFFLHAFQTQAKKARFLLHAEDLSFQASEPFSARQSPRFERVWINLAAGSSWVSSDFEWRRAVWDACHPRSRSHSCSHQLAWKM